MLKTKQRITFNLSSFLEQDYPDYEVIVVDDQSIDSTKYVLKDFEKNYSNLKVVSIEPHVNSRVAKVCFNIRNKNSKI